MLLLLLDSGALLPGGGIGVLPRPGLIIVSWVLAVLYEYGSLFSGFLVPICVVGRVARVVRFIEGNLLQVDLSDLRLVARGLPLSVFF